MPSITVTVGGWKAEIEIENEDGLKRAAYEIVHDRIITERGTLSIQYATGAITVDEFNTKIAILDQLGADTRAALDADLPAIQWEAV